MRTNIVLNDALIQEAFLYIPSKKCCSGYILDNRGKLCIEKLLPTEVFLLLLVYPHAEP